MSERVEEIRRLHEYVHPIRAAADCDTCWFLSRLAQADREREEDIAELNRALAVEVEAVALARAEVERLKGELNEAKEEVRRQVEMRMLDQGRHHVDLQETPSQIVPESLCSCGETLRELEADLARVRAALDRKHVCVFEACCNDAVRAALEGRG
jgi:chromosome segregation ATPase